MHYKQHALQTTCTTNNMHYKQHALKQHAL